MRGKADFEHVREMPLGNAAKGRRFEHKYGNCSIKQAFAGSKGWMASRRKPI
jgi:hypothetical protein